MWRSSASGVPGQPMAPSLGCTIAVASGGYSPVTRHPAAAVADVALRPLARGPCVDDRGPAAGIATASRDQPVRRTPRLRVASRVNGRAARPGRTRASRAQAGLRPPAIRVPRSASAMRTTPDVERAEFVLAPLLLPEHALGRTPAPRVGVLHPPVELDGDRGVLEPRVDDADQPAAASGSRPAAPASGRPAPTMRSRPRVSSGDSARPSARATARAARAAPGQCADRPRRAAQLGRASSGRRAGRRPWRRRRRRAATPARSRPGCVRPW